MTTLYDLLLTHLARKHSHPETWPINVFAAFYRGEFVVYTHHKCVDLATSIVHYPFVRLNHEIGYGMPHEFIHHKKAERLYKAIEGTR